MNRFYKSYHHGLGEVITNGDVYLCGFDRYHYSGRPEVRFTETLEDAGFFCTLSLKVLLRYLNMRFKEGIPEDIIDRT